MGGERGAPVLWIEEADELAVLDLWYTHEYAWLHGGGMATHALHAIRALYPFASSVRIGSRFDYGRISSHNSNLYEAGVFPPTRAPSLAIALALSTWQLAIGDWRLASIGPQRALTDPAFRYFVPPLT